MLKESLRYIASTLCTFLSIRLAPEWSDGFVTLARAQRELGEVELALQNMQTAYTLRLAQDTQQQTNGYRVRSGDITNSSDNMFDGGEGGEGGELEASVTSICGVMSTSTDSNVGDIEMELAELQGLVMELEKRREAYLEELLRNEEAKRNEDERLQGKGSEESDVEEAHQDPQQQHSGSGDGIALCRPSGGGYLCHPARQEDRGECRRCLMNLTSRVRVGVVPPSSNSSSQLK